MGLFVEDIQFEQMGGIQPLSVVIEKEIEYNLNRLLEVYTSLYDLPSVKAFVRSKSPRMFGHGIQMESAYIHQIEYHVQAIKSNCWRLEASGYETGDETYLRRIHLLLEAFEATRDIVYEANHKANAAKLGEKQ